VVIEVDILKVVGGEEVVESVVGIENIVLRIDDIGVADALVSVVDVVDVVVSFARSLTDVAVLVLCIDVVVLILTAT
jgi:hypothetical protein